MNYCDNCKVKIRNNTNICPLCHSYIENNNKLEHNKLKIERIDKDINIEYFSKMVLSILIICTIIVMFINLIINKKLSWSFYVLFSSIYVCGHYYIINYKNKLLGFLINVFTLELLLLVISKLSGNINWFIYLVGPFILIGTIFCVIDYLLITSSKNILRNNSLLLLYIGISTVLINIFINKFNIGVFNISWSIYSFIPIFIVSLVMYIMSYNKKIVNEIEKRFFI